VHRNAEQGLQVVADGRAIATTAATIANGLGHAGVVAVPLDGRRALSLRRERRAPGGALAMASWSCAGEDSSTTSRQRCLGSDGRRMGRVRR
jgi:hypothetical protein